MKKIISVFLSIILVISMCSIGAFAQESGTAEEKNYDMTNEHPWVFVHGMGGWVDWDGEAYWGGWADSEGDVIALYNSMGVEAYAAEVGPFNSAWDRACEVYAQLTGTVVDYGAAHSEAHCHDRYGYDYTDKCIMPEPWDTESAINLVGHSFGGPAVRLFASLIAYGDADEIAATGEDTSPLFKGGHENAIHAVVTFSGVHNGSPIANLVHDSPLMTMIFTLLNFWGSTVGRNLLMWDMQMGHIGLTPTQDEERTSFSMEKVRTAVANQDNCGYDLTLRGAAELNEKIKTVENAYYYSYSCNASDKTAVNTYVPISTTFALFIPTSIYIGALEGKTIDGVYMDETWAKNDGIVPLASALYPSDEADTARSYEEAVNAGEKIETGRWYYMPIMEGFDHFDFCGTIDYPTSFEDFYCTLVETVNAN